MDGQNSRCVKCKKEVEPYEEEVTVWRTDFFDRPVFICEKCQAIEELRL